MDVKIRPSHCPPTPKLSACGSPNPLAKHKAVCSLHRRGLAGPSPVQGPSRLLLRGDLSAEQRGGGRLWQGDSSRQQEVCAVLGSRARWQACLPAAASEQALCNKGRGLAMGSPSPLAGGGWRPGGRRLSVSTVGPACAGKASFSGDQGPWRGTSRNTRWSAPFWHFPGSLGLGENAA